MPAPTPEAPVGLPRKHQRLRLYRRDSIGLSYHVLTFETDAPTQARAGQFVMIRSATSGRAPLLPRPMSLLTAGERPSILVKVVGEATERFAHASSGELFDLLLPLGSAWSPCPADYQPLLIAGGVGVAPLLFLAREFEGTAVPRPMALYGGRTASDLPLASELGALAELRVATEDGSLGTTGRVTVLTETVLRELGTQPRVKVYTCGPRAMMAAVARLCRSLHVRCEVSLEAPMACGYGVCLGCAVPRAAAPTADPTKAEAGYIYACTEGPCVDGAHVKWSDGA